VGKYRETGRDYTQWVGTERQTGIVLSGKYRDMVYTTTEWDTHWFAQTNAADIITGQNVVFGSASWLDAVYAWYNEKITYNFVYGGSNLVAQVGHYSQVSYK